VTTLHPALWLPGIQAAAFAAGFAICGQSALLRRLLRPEWRSAAAERAAALAFMDQGLASTRERTGILIHVSLLEHQVVVLADRGIAERVAPGTWDRVVHAILKGIREKRAEEGLRDGVQLCSDVLAEHFPPGADNPNELPDPVRR
jgi:putative membrane protein